MNESQISVRYAKALFQSALDQNLLEDVYKDMELLTSTCKGDEFQYMLVVPTLQPSQKNKLMIEIFEKQFSKISMALISLVVQNKRETYLSGIARYFMDLYRKEKGICIASLRTAQPVDEAALNGIRGLIKNAYDSDVELTSSVNEDVIGGFVLTVEDMQYDASVATNLRKIKKQLLQTSIEK